MRDYNPNIKQFLLFIGFAVITVSPVNAATYCRGVDDITIKTPCDAEQGTVCLFMHGLGSNPKAAFRKTAKKFLDNCGFQSKTKCMDEQCPIVSVNSAIPQGKSCYRMKFSDLSETTSNGELITWEDGDGLSFEQLGSEVSVVVNSLIANSRPQAIILVGESRGGLAARAYLQTLIPGQVSTKFGLVTAGTPHLGSPLGRGGYFLTEELGHQWRLEYEKKLPSRFYKLLFSPSSKYLANEIVNGQLYCGDGTLAHAICNFKEEAGLLKQTVDAFGQVRNVDGFKLEQTLKGLAKFVFGLVYDGVRNIPEDVFNMGMDFALGDIDDNDSGWLRGDGLVPGNSSRIQTVVGEFTAQDPPIFEAKSRKWHTSQGNDSEIKEVLCKVADHLLQ